ncbi:MULTISPECIES: dsRBD fold-containing protein [unclassified Streptomyces]|uniref:dsRBD fold-containing protein n=1 Tax=unclassified Streptomyces TaxID=2593676 RepID=UPI001CD7FB05|nr:dsRBD fold-containing protein [Streptomyces sp. CoH27]
MTDPMRSRLPAVKEWRLNLYLSEHDPDTTARIVLDTGDNVLESCAEARRNPYDPDVPEIGDELAAGRALIAMGRILLRAADGDIKAVGADEAEEDLSPLWTDRE